MTDSFLWHDYEAFGINPRIDRPAQFAAVRTNAALEIIGEPVQWYCQPGADMVPDPQACLITGITPQQALKLGLPEHQFAQQIQQQMMQPRTCTVGYNSLRYDDEMTRFLLYRNCIEPYQREWSGGNSRWDLLDVMRLAYALRPQGICWPRNDQGEVSFKLEQLSQANHIDHAQAHDALADVQATLALARLLRQAQPRLYQFALNLRAKSQVLQHLAVGQYRPLLHVSGRFPAAQGCLAVVLPLAVHPLHQNEVILYNLMHSPKPWLSASVEQMQADLFTPSAERVAEQQRLPLKTIHLNRCPMVAPLTLLDDALCQRWGIDRASIDMHRQMLLQNPHLIQRLCQVFAQPAAWPQQDIDTQLYQGFISKADQARMQQLTRLVAADYGQLQFEDPRLQQLLIRLKARNYPDQLSTQERAQWQERCLFCYQSTQAGGSLTLEQALKQAQQQVQQHASEPAQAVLQYLLMQQQQARSWQQSLESV